MNVRNEISFVRKLVVWLCSGNRDLTPPPARVKRYLLRRIARSHGIRTFVETGTYQGGTVEALRDSFDRVITIELSPELCSAAQRKFAGDPRITVHCGDSAAVLPDIMTTVKEPALFWLDAHYSAGTTARGVKDTPIISELEAIFAQPVSGSVIAIDDARDFGSGDYPTLAEVEKLARSKGIRSVQVRNNMIILEGTDPHPLADRQSYAQFGEDAIIERLVAAIGRESRQCVEFGAWDGLRGSNTALLWRSQGWRALLIEAREDRYRKLVRNARGFAATCVNARVGLSERDSIDTIAKAHGFGPVVDVLSIDIDGDDYWILDSLRFLRPRIVICEFNPTIPPRQHLVGEYGERIGCSAASLIDLASRRGFMLCGATDSNLFFVAREHAPALAAAGIPTGGDVTVPETHLRYVISDYDGNYSFSGRPTYGMRTARRPRTHLSDMALVAPQGLASYAAGIYHDMKNRLYRLVKRIR